MRRASSQPNTLRIWIIAVTFWAVSSLLQGVITTHQEGVPFPYALVTSALYFGGLSVLAIPVWIFCSWLEERRPPLWQSAGLHVGVLVLVVGLWQSVYAAFVYLVAGPEVIEVQIEAGGLWLLLQAVLVYTLMVSGIVAIQKSRRLEEQERRSAELRLLAREAELRALRAQLRPHFLFNVLNSIYSQIRVEPEKAEKMTELLSGLLRATLEVSDQPLVPLEEELALTRRYLAIEQLRLGERLTTRLEIDRSVRSAAVPPLILQPLVENAVLHGVAPFSKPGSIGVRALKRSSHLECLVRDSGNGPQGGRPREGKGLGITRARLEKLWGGGASIEFKAPEGGGFEVLLKLPLEGLPEEA